MPKTEAQALVDNSWDAMVRRFATALDEHLALRPALNRRGPLGPMVYGVNGRGQPDTVHRDIQHSVIVRTRPTQPLLESRASLSLELGWLRHEDNSVDPKLGQELERLAIAVATVEEHLLLDGVPGVMPGLRDSTLHETAVICGHLTIERMRRAIERLDERVLNGSADIVLPMVSYKRLSGRPDLKTAFQAELRFGSIRASLAIKLPILLASQDPGLEITVGRAYELILAEPPASDRVRLECVGSFALRVLVDRPAVLEFSNPCDIPV